MDRHLDKDEIRRGHIGTYYCTQNGSAMAPKAIREYDGKRLLAKHIGTISSGKHQLEDRLMQITPGNFDQFKVCCRASED